MVATDDDGGRAFGQDRGHGLFGQGERLVGIAGGVDVAEVDEHGVFFQVDAELGVPAIALAGGDGPDGGRSPGRAPEIARFLVEGDAQDGDLVVGILGKRLRGPAEIGHRRPPRMTFVRLYPNRDSSPRRSRGRRGREKNRGREILLLPFHNLGTASFEAVAPLRLRPGAESHGGPGGSIAGRGECRGEKIPVCSPPKVSWTRRRDQRGPLWRPGPPSIIALHKVRREAPWTRTDPSATATTSSACSRPRSTTSGPSASSTSSTPTRCPRASSSTRIRS